MVIAKPARCRHRQAASAAGGHALAARRDEIDPPQVRPVATRVERYGGRRTCRGAATLAAVPEGLEPGTPFGVDVVAPAMCLRFTRAVSYKRLTRLPPDPFGLAVGEGALDAAFRRARPRFDADVAAVLARLRRARVVCSDETAARVAGRTRRNWAFQNAEVVVHVVRRSRGAEVVSEVLAGHRPAPWVPGLYGARQGHAEARRVCLAHQLRGCARAIEAGDAVFAPRMKALPPRDGRAFMRERCARVRGHLFTFLDHAEIAADNNSGERELRPTATRRKVAGGVRSEWGADLFAAVRSVIGTARRRGIGAYQAIRDALRGQSALQPVRAVTAFLQRGDLVVL